MCQLYFSSQLICWFESTQESISQDSSSVLSRSDLSGSSRSDSSSLILAFRIEQCASLMQRLVLSHSSQFEEDIVEVVLLERIAYILTLKISLDWNSCEDLSLGPTGAGWFPNCRLGPNAECMVDRRGEWSISYIILSS